MSALSVEDLKVSYGDIHAVKGISFEVREGEVFTLIGANGAGKTSTLRAISGLLRHLGRVRFGGRELDGVAPDRIVALGMAHVPEGRGIFGNLTVIEQQMLAVARALMSNARTLLLDEPSMGLAPKLVKEIYRVVRDINETGVTILLVEQNANLALRLADRAAVLENGRISLTGSGAELLQNSQVREAFLGA